MSASYPIGTLEQMAAIPEEALPRFLAELPAILAEQREWTAISAGLQVIVGDAGKVVPASPEWIDDDLDQLTRSIAVGDDVIAQIVTSRESTPSKTREMVG
jgi:hypothetical protein